MEAYLKSEPPSSKQRVKRPKQEAFDLLLPKFQSILERGYVVSNQGATEIAELEEFIMLYIDYFGVPKVALVVGSMKPFGHQIFGCLPQNPLLEF
jgi:hypothetical protein